MLDGEQVLLTTAFCILRIHRKKLLHLKSFDSINSFLKNELCTNFANSSLTIDEIIEEYVVCYEKLKQNNLLSLPSPTENEIPTKPFNISMGDITKFTDNNSNKNANSEETSKSKGIQLLTFRISRNFTICCQQCNNSFNEVYQKFLLKDNRNIFDRQG